MEQDKYIALVYKSLKGEISPLEVRELDLWISASIDHQKLRDQIAEEWDLSKNYVPNIEVDVKADFRKLKQRINLSDNKKGKEVQMRPRSNWLGRVAGLIMLVSVGYWVYQYNNRPDVVMYAETGHGATKVVDLPDGSKVTLNELSVLRYRASPTKRIRSIDFRGEAFFEVARDSLKPFIIKTRLANVSVLGTSFNVRANPGEDNITVSVESGKVRFHPFGSESGMDLEKNEEGFFEWSNKKLEKRPPNKNANAWRTGNWTYNEQPLSEVIDQLKRQFDVDIKVRNIEMLACPFTGRFQENEIEPIIAYIAEVYEMQLSTSQDSSYLLNGGVCIQ